MKKLFYKILVIIPAFLILNSIFLTRNCMSQWVPMSNGMNPGTNVKSLAYNSSYIFAGVSNYGIYRSGNFGINWNPTSMPTLYVYSIVTNETCLFAGTQANGIYRSTNNGTNFTQVYANGSEIPLAVNGNYIFAGNLFPSIGVSFSTNNGSNWTQTSLDSVVIKCFAVSGNNIFAGANPNGIYLSTNNGSTWTQTSMNNQDVRSIAISGNNIFAGTNPNGVFLSTNNGSTWAQTSLNNVRINALITRENNVFAGTNDGNIYQSTDNGVTWIPRNEGNPGGPNSFLIAYNLIYAGGGGGLYARELSQLIGIQKISTEIPNSFSLSQNYPNPFNPVTKIRFDIPKKQLVNIKIFDILGREVANPVNEKLIEGTYEVEWDASNYPSGIYFYKMITESFITTKKMILVK